MARIEPVRVTVITGFLGAGKTTLLNRLLADPGVTDTAVIVNEFGEAGIDHLLVETARDGIVELSDGCLCCTIRGDLVDTLADLADRMQTGRMAPLKRVVVETTGLADPTPVLAALMGHPALLQAYALDGVVTVVDALAGADNLDTRDEARRQVAVADRLVLTKTDLASGDAARDLRTSLRRLNPRAPVLDAAKGEATPDRLFDCGLFDPATKIPDVARWLGETSAGMLSGDGPAAAPDDEHRHDHAHHGHHHHHRGRSGEPSRHGAIASFSIVRDEPVPMAAVEGFLDLLTATQGRRLLRMKAIIATVEHPGRPLVLHAVRTYLHPPVRLAAWPAGTVPGSRLVSSAMGSTSGMCAISSPPLPATSGSTRRTVPRSSTTRSRFPVSPPDIGGGALGRGGVSPFPARFRVRPGSAGGCRWSRLRGAGVPRSGRHGECRARPADRP